MWDQNPDEAFQKLKMAMAPTLVLGLLDFYKPFTQERHGSRTEIGGVLMQEGRHIAF